MSEPRMSHAAAEAVTAEIRTVAGSIADNLTRLRGLVAHARDGGADVALGFRSWTEYLAEIVGTVRTVVREQRRAVAAYLADQGLSTRAIAPIVGVHYDTVASDLRSQLSESPTTERDVSIVVADAPDGQPVRLRVITGRDGKTYPRPAVPGPAAVGAIAAPAPPSPSPSAPLSVSAPRSKSDYDFKRPCST